MRILVVDDMRHNVDAAWKFFGLKHKLTVDDNAYGGMQKAREGYDAVLLDLNMPVVPNLLCGTREIKGYYHGYPELWEGDPQKGESFPVGLFIALVAAANGTKHIGVLTDGSHHSDASAAAVDWVMGAPLTVNGAKVIITSDHELFSDYRRDDEGFTTPIEGFQVGQGELIRVKRWDLLLERLLGD